MTPFKRNEKVDLFLANYHLYEEDAIQQVQLQHRLELVEAFGIQEGMRVLEIGCGQGDTTAALAHAVGESGRVVAIDIASPDYGAPLTLGEAAERIKNSPLGGRTEFYFETDFLTFDSAGAFDVAVLSHCSWYFNEPSDLLHYFRKLRKMVKRVCFAEWDLDFGSMAQRSHFCAATILALHSNFVQNDGNIQCLFGKNQIQHLLEYAGFKVSSQRTIAASYLQDGQWEKNYTNSIQSAFSAAPEAIQAMVASYYGLMNATDMDVQSLDSFVFCAE